MFYSNGLISLSKRSQNTKKNQKLKHPQKQKLKKWRKKTKNKPKKWEGFVAVEMEVNSNARGTSHPSSNPHQK